jgi:hypothetical protein
MPMAATGPDVGTITPRIGFSCAKAGNEALERLIVTTKIGNRIFRPTIKTDAIYTGIRASSISNTQHRNANWTIIKPNFMITADRRCSSWTIL